MPSTTTPTRELPTPAELSDVSDKLASYLGAFSGVEGALTKAAYDSLSVAEYKRLKAAGEPIPEPPLLDADRLAHLALFAIDTINTLDAIREAAVKLREDAVFYYFEQTELGLRPARPKRVEPAAREAGSDDA